MGAPRVVIGTIEVVVEAEAPPSATQRSAGFSRDPGRYYLRRL